MFIASKIIAISFAVIGIIEAIIAFIAGTFLAGLMGVSSAVSNSSHSADAGSIFKYSGIVALAMLVASILGIIGSSYVKNERKLSTIFYGIAGLLCPILFILLSRSFAYQFFFLYISAIPFLISGVLGYMGHELEARRGNS